MIYDAFMFRNEFECLEIRLNELSPVVDEFILVEGSLTHQGAVKRPEFALEAGWYNEFPIEYVAVTDWPETDDSWVREAHQRDQTLCALSDASANDIVLISDVDEIPSAEAVVLAAEKIRSGLGQISFEQLLSFYVINNVCQTPWYGTQAVPMNMLWDRKPSGVRSRRNHVYALKNAGWHWSWLGDGKAAVEKMESFAHAEFNRPEYKERAAALVASREEIVSTDRVFRLEEADSLTLPSYLLENRERFAHLFA